MNRFRLLLLFALPALGLYAATPTESAVALVEAKQFPAAREAFAKIAAAEPQNAAAHFYLGVIAGQLGENDEAIRQLEQATALAPTKADYLLQLADAYGVAVDHAGLLSKLGWARKIQATLERAVQVDPDNIAARNGLVTYYRQAPTFAGGGMSKAYEQAEEIRKRDPVAGATILGQLYLADRKVDEAFAVYEAALKVAPDYYGLLYGIGRAAAQTGRHLDLGEKSLRRCLELPADNGYPGHAPVNWRLGNIAEKRGDRVAARAAYEAALQLEPDFKEARASLANLK